MISSDMPFLLRKGRRVSREATGRPRSVTCRETGQDVLAVPARPLKVGFLYLLPHYWTSRPPTL